jgi:hypothetical protein
LLKLLFAHFANGLEGNTAAVKIAKHSKPLQTHLFINKKIDTSQLHISRARRSPPAKKKGKALYFYLLLTSLLCVYLTFKMSF